MHKQQLLEKIDAAWSALQDSVAGLSEAQMTEPGVTESWSVKDILAHVTTWEQEALKHLPGILRGEKPPRYKDAYGGLDAFNALKTQEKRELSLADVRQQMEDTHRAFVAYVEGAPDDQIYRETPFRRRIRLDTYGHYPYHTQAILAWRERTGRSR